MGDRWNLVSEHMRWKDRNPIQTGYVGVVYRNNVAKELVRPEQSGKVAELIGVHRGLGTPLIGRLAVRIVSTTERTIPVALKDLSTLDGYRVESLTLTPTVRIDPDRLVIWAASNSLGELEANLRSHLTRDVGMFVRRAFSQLSMHEVMKQGEMILHTIPLHAPASDQSGDERLRVFNGLMLVTSLGIVEEVQYSQIMRKAYEAESQIHNELTREGGQARVDMLKATSFAAQAQVLGVPPVIAQNPELLKEYLNANKEIGGKAKLVESMQATDKAKRQALFDELHRRMLDEVPLIPLYNGLQINAIGPRVAGFHGWPAELPRLWNVRLQ